MLVGRVVGNLVATRKEERLIGCKFLLVELLGSGEKEMQKLVAVDHIGAGCGELVLITQGSSARKSLPDRELPVDAAVVGIIDEELEMG